MTKTSIEWCDEIWNPTTGCTKVSAGCKNCYAERIAKRFWGERKFTDVQCHPERLDKPFYWRKPRRVFVDSMSDLFHPDVPDDFILEVFVAMEDSPNYTFMILTKRPDRMLDFRKRRWVIRDGEPWVYPNIWLGVSVENQQAADERIPLLLQTSAAVRFVSVEPMLEKIDLRKVQMPDGDDLGPTLFNFGYDVGIDWVICGCESGPGARPMELDWAAVFARPMH